MKSQTRPGPVCSRAAATPPVRLARARTTLRDGRAGLHDASGLDVVVLYLGSPSTLAAIHGPLTGSAARPGPRLPARKMVAGPYSGALRERPNSIDRPRSDSLPRDALLTWRSSIGSIADSVAGRCSDAHVDSAGWPMEEHGVPHRQHLAPRASRPLTSSTGARVSPSTGAWVSTPVFRSGRVRPGLVDRASALVFDARFFFRSPSAPLVPSWRHSERWCSTSMRGRRRGWPSN